MDSFERLIVIIITVALFVIKPLQYACSIQESVSAGTVECLTQEFVNAICFYKELTVEEYEAFQKKLYETGNVYDIELVLGNLVEMTEASNAGISDTSKVHTNNRDNQIVSLSTEAQHIHDDRCYFGDRHICSAFGGSCYTWDPYYYQYPHSHTSSCPSVSHAGYGTYCVTGSYTWVCGHGNGASDPGASAVTNSIETYYCNYCGAQTGVRTEYDCPSCSSGGWSGSSGSCSKTTITCTVQHDYSGEYVKTCGKISGHYYHNGMDETNDPKCHLVVTGIYPLEYYQEIEQGETIDTSCAAVYLDGHNAIITCLDDYGGELGYSLVNLLYNGLIYTAKTIGTLNETIQVRTVKYYTCPDCGTKYEGDENGEDPGCPACRERVLEVRVNLLQNEYELGEELRLEVIAVYTDREEMVTDWTSSYDAFTPGRQEVMVECLEQFTWVWVTVLEQSSGNVTCTECGLDYDQDEESCPDCSRTIIDMAACVEKAQVRTGENPGFYIVITYQDGNELAIEEGESGFEVFGFDTFTPGQQEITLSFGGYVGTVTVTVLGEDDYEVCDNGHKYRPGEAEGGCPYCSAEQEEGAYQFLDITYHEVLLHELYEKGKLVFEEGSFLSIKITAEPSVLTAMKERIALLGKAERGYQYQYRYGKEMGG